MTEPEKNNVDKAKIVGQIADLSRLLGMVPANDQVVFSEPGTQQSMALPDWLDETRNTFLNLSVQLDRVLNLNLP